MSLLLPAVLAPALWAAVAYANAVACGWPRLAARYGAGAPPSPEARRFGRVPGRVGGVSLRGALIVGAEPEGLRLSVPGWMRPGRPPLLVPWSELAVAGRGTLDAHPVVTLRVGADAAGSVTIPLRVAQQIPELGVA